MKLRTNNIIIVVFLCLFALSCCVNFAISYDNCMQLANRQTWDIIKVVIDGIVAAGAIFAAFFAGRKLL